MGRVGGWREGTYGLDDASGCLVRLDEPDRVRSDRRCGAW